MTKKKLPQTPSELLDIVADFLADTSDADIENVEAELVKRGFGQQAAVSGRMYPVTPALFCTQHALLYPSVCNFH